MKKLTKITEERAERFVIRKISTGKFYKNTTSRGITWSDDLCAAFMFKKEHTARAYCTCNEYGNSSLLTLDEWQVLKRMPPEKRVKVFDDDFEILKVQIEVVNEKVNKNNRRTGKRAGR